MKRNITKITESQLRQIIQETVMKIINEDGESAATNGSGMFNGTPSANISANASYDVPFGKGVVRKKGYSPTGDVTKAPNSVDMTPALERKPGGSIAMTRQK